MKNLRLVTTRELVNGVVLPVTDYVSITWFPRTAVRIVTSLNAVHGAAAQACIYGFRTCTRDIVETNTAMKTLAERLPRKSDSILDRLKALLRTHPTVVLVKRAPCRRLKSLLQAITE